MRIKHIYLIALLTVTGFSSCKKDDTKKESKTDIIASSSWSFDTYGVDTNGDLLLTGNEVEMRACDADDVFTFSKSGTLTHNMGADNCGSSQTSTQDTWSLTNDETGINYIGYTYKIKSLSQSKMEIYLPGPASSAVVVFKR